MLHRRKMQLFNYHFHRLYLLPGVSPLCICPHPIISPTTWTPNAHSPRYLFSRVHPWHCVTRPLISFLVLRGSLCIIYHCTRTLGGWLFSLSVSMPGLDTTGVPALGTDDHHKGDSVFFVTLSCMRALRSPCRFCLAPSRCKYTRFWPLRGPA